MHLSSGIFLTIGRKAKWSNGARDERSNGAMDEGINYFL